jgi:tetratricopeptide (TPR) repeat protein
MKSSVLRRKGRFWQWVVIVTPILLLVSIGGGYWWYSHFGPEPPSVPREGLEPAVAAAIDAGRESVLRHPRSWTAWGHLGKVLLAHKFPEEARLCFVQAEYLDSKEPRWPYFQGIILSLTDNSTAIVEFRRAVDLCGNEPENPRLKLAEALVEDGNSEAALKQFELLLQDKPSHPLAHLGLARLAMDRNDWKETQVHLQYAADSPYSRKAAHALLASYYQLHGDAVSAEKELRLVAQLPNDSVSPDPFNDELVALRVDRRSRFKKATQLLVEKRLTEAADALQKLVEEFPDMDMAWRILGRTQLQMGDLPGAEHSLKTALRLHPDSVEGQYYLGLLSLTRKKYEVAKSYFQRAIELKPDYALAHYQLARCFSGQGERAHAIQELQTALQCQPYLAEAHRDLGELLALNGQAKEAAEHLRQAVELDRTDEKAQKILEKLKNLSGGRKTPERE